MWHKIWNFLGINCNFWSITHNWHCTGKYILTAPGLWFMVESMLVNSAERAPTMEDKSVFKLFHITLYLPKLGFENVFHKYCWEGTQVTDFKAQNQILFHEYRQVEGTKAGQSHEALPEGSSLCSTLQAAHKVLLNRAQHSGRNASWFQLGRSCSLSVTVVTGTVGHRMQVPFPCLSLLSSISIGTDYREEDIPNIPEVATKMQGICALLQTSRWERDAPNCFEISTTINYLDLASLLLLLLLFFSCSHISLAFSNPSFLFRWIF